MQAELRKKLQLPGYDPVTTAGDCTFDEKAANDACDFFPECLSHIEGKLAGKPFILEPWQWAVIANLFGWKRPDGSRRYRTAFLFVARKNGKTPMAAGIANYTLFCEDEIGQQDVCAAGDREQATLLFRHACGMIRHEPEMDSRCDIYGERGTNQTRTIFVPETNSYLKVVSAEAPGKHGGNLHLALIDELHVQPNRELVDVLETSMASENRRQPLIIYITTSDFSRPSICNEKYDYACKVRDGIVEDESFLPIIFETDIGDDWKDERIWVKANPNLGVSVSLDYMRRKCKEAQETPAFENTFKRLHLNIRTEQDVRWLSMDKWDGCDELIEAADLRGRACYGGLDLSSTTDLTSFNLIFPPVTSGDDYVLLSFYWVPKDNIEKRKRRDKVPYDLWAKQGFIKLTPGNVVDYDIVRADIKALGEIYNIKSLGIDRWAATQIITQLEGDGFEVVPFGQGFASMSAPTKELEKLVLGQQLNHGKNPVTRWCASNVTIEIDAAENIKPSKKKSTERIDGIVATIIGLGCLLAAEEEADSVYNKRGLLVI